MNAGCRSGDGKFRDECLATQWFKNRIDAKILIEEFRRGYDEVRPHSVGGRVAVSYDERKWIPFSCFEDTGHFVTGINRRPRHPCQAHSSKTYCLELCERSASFMRYTPPKEATQNPAEAGSTDSSLCKPSHVPGEWSQD